MKKSNYVEASEGHIIYNQAKLNFGKHQEPPPEGAPRVGEEKPFDYKTELPDDMVVRINKLKLK